MSHTGRNFQQMIRARGYRMTRQRRLILDAICEGGGHTTVDQIYARVQAKNPHINLATLYRNLDFLCRLRLVLAADLGSGHTVYEIARETPHHHLVCRVCGAEITLEHDEIKPFLDQVTRQHDFALEVDHLTLIGVCSACRPPENCG